MVKKLKIDRRTRYTVQVIKDAFLELSQTQPYAKITVSNLCRQAEITRSTFYLHFDNLTAVLNAVLEDALLFTATPQPTSTLETPISVDALKKNESLLPACQRIADASKYHQLLMDDGLSDYIIGRIIAHERHKIVPSIQKRTGLSEAEAETLFIYAIHGSFAINKRHHFIKDDAWYRDVTLLNQFVSTGYTAFKDQK